MNIEITYPCLITLSIGFVVFAIGSFYEGRTEWVYGCWNYSSVIAAFLIFLSCMFLKFERGEE